MATKRVRYVGCHAEVRVNVGDRTVMVGRNQAAEFAAGFADRLLAEPDNWQPADGEPKAEPKPAEAPAPAKKGK